MTSECGRLGLIFGSSTVIVAVRPMLAVGAVQAGAGEHIFRGITQPYNQSSWTLPASLFSVGRPANRSLGGYFSVESLVLHTRGALLAKRNKVVPLPIWRCMAAFVPIDRLHTSDE